MPYYITFTLILCSCSLFAQFQPAIPEEYQDQLEAFVSNLDDPGQFDFNTISEVLLQYLRNPLDLNKADTEELEEMGLLGDQQISDLIDYRENYGDLISIYELQVIQSFDIRIIRLIRPFVRVRSVSDNVSLRDMFRGGYNQVFLRYGRTVQDKAGYRGRDGQEAAYLGNADRYYFRYRYDYENRLSYGFTMEKDPGELLFSGNAVLPDYTSFHFYIKNLSHHLKALVLGDFQVGLGQGLIMHSGFGRGKSSMVNTIKKGGRTIRPYTSVSENRFLRGGAVHLASGHWEALLFTSFNKHDGNLVILDSGERVLTSFQESGYHRTLSEIEDRDAFNQWVSGGKIGYTQKGFKANINLVYNRFNISYDPRKALYNQFYFRGKSSLNVSFDYTFQHRNLHLFGESAISEDGGFASINGMLLTVSRKLDFSLLYRYYGVDYHALFANAFAESTQVNNEQGLYLGMEFRINDRLRFNAYADRFQFDWLKFNADVPSRGNEYLCRITYYVKRKLEIYAQYRSETKGFSSQLSDSRLHSNIDRTRQYARIHFNHNLTQYLELRNRIEFSWIDEQSSMYKGFLIYQDMLYKPLEFPLSFTTRIAFFDMDDYAARIYAYENDLLFNFSIPGYFGKGIRYYFNLRYQLSRNITVEARWDQTCFADRDFIGSGWEEIEGNKRSNIKLQCRITF